MEQPKLLQLVPYQSTITKPQVMRILAHLRLPATTAVTAAAATVVTASQAMTYLEDKEPQSSMMAKKAELDRKPFCNKAAKNEWNTWTPGLLHRPGPSGNDPNTDDKRGRNKLGISTNCEYEQISCPELPEVDQEDQSLQLQQPHAPTLTTVLREKTDYKRTPLSLNPLTQQTHKASSN